MISFCCYYWTIILLCLQCSHNCNNGTRRRSVLCRRSREGDDIDKGRIVSDNECIFEPGAMPMPDDIETCEALFPNDCLLDPIWVIGPFSFVSKIDVCKG